MQGTRVEPWSGKIPHAAEQLGPWATTTEAARLEPVLRTKRGHDSKRPAHRDEEWPPLDATRESPDTEMKTQHSNPSINKVFKKKQKQKKRIQIYPLYEQNYVEKLKEKYWVSPTL